MPLNSNVDSPGALPGRSAKTRILIIDDHSVVREGLKQLLNEQPDFEVCAEAESVTQARAAAVSSNPGMVITDLSLGNEDGIGLLKELRRRHPRLPILVLSMHDEMLYAERMLSLGANGYVSKSAPGSELLRALRTVIGGGVHLSQQMSAHLLNRLATNGSGTVVNPVDGLSTRELEVLNLLGQGLGTRGAAQALHLSIKTIESHRQRIKQKLRLKTGTQLLQFAFTWFSGSTSAAPRSAEDEPTR